MEKFEPLQKFEVAETLFKNNMSITAAAKIVGIDRKKLARYFKNKGYKYESRQPNREKYKKAMMEYKEGGVSLESLRQKYKLDRNKLSKMLKECGVEVRGHKSTSKELTDKIEEAESYFLGGFSLKKAAVTVGINYYTLREYLDEQGYDASTNRRKYTLDENIFEKIDTEAKAYWLGFLYADAYNNTLEGKVELTLKKSDITHLVKFQRFLKSTAPINSKIIKLKTKEYEAVRITICSKKLSQDLSKLGCTKNKSFTIAFPNNSIVPFDLITHFIRGYFDGDGSIYVHDNGIGATVSILGTLDFLTGVQKAMNLHKVKFGSKGNVYELSYGGGKLIIDILNRLYKNANVYLDRKYDIYKILTDNREKRYQNRLSTINMVVALYKQGKTTREIHEETGIFKHLIVCWLEYYADYEPNRNPTQINENDKKSTEVLKLLKQGYGHRKIDRIVKTSTYRVKLVAMKAGLTDNELL